MRRRTFLKAVGIAGAGLFGLRRRAFAEVPATPVIFPKFNQPLPMFGVEIPIATPNTYADSRYGGQLVDHYTIHMSEYQYPVYRETGWTGMADTTFWGYKDMTTPGSPSYGVNAPLGPAILARRGRPVAVSWENHLPENHPLDAVNLTIDPTTFEAGANVRKNRAVPHLHGGFVPWTSDGGPRSWFLPDGTHGPLYRGSEFIYPNAQRATLMFYHDHAQGITRTNAYVGIAAAYVVGDEDEDRLVGSGDGGAVPPLGDTIFGVIVDRAFYPSGDLWYPNTYGLPFDPLLTITPSAVPEAFFDVMTVNGAVYPFKEVNKRRYRLRLLNACNARFLKLRLVEAAPDGVTPTTTPGPPFVQIGTEGGFLPGPVTLTHAAGRSPLTLGCAERADIIVDFRNCDVGKKYILVNEAGAPFPDGSPDFDLLASGPGLNGAGVIMRFDVIAGNAQSTSWVPPALRLPVIPRISPTRAVATRKLILQEGVDALGRIQPILGELGNYAGYAFDSPATETPAAGTVEIWEIYNLTGDAHPIHFHMVNGQILGRQRINVIDQMIGGNLLPTFAGFAGVGRPADANEQGWKETVRMNPGEMTKMIFDFTLPPFAQPENIPPFGNGHHYVWHCHILEHEEHDMMRPTIVTA